MARPTAIYALNVDIDTELPGLLANDSVSGLKEFVIAILKFADRHGSTELSRPLLNEALASHLAPPQAGKPAKPLSTANSMVIRRVRELESLGCLRIHSEYRQFSGKPRKCTIHNFESFAGLKKHLNDGVQRSPSPQGRPKLNDLVVYADSLEEKGITRLEADGEVVPYTEGAFGILEAAARAGSDKDKLINCTYHLKKDDRIQITTSTSTKEGAGIMFSSDQRVIQALNGMLKAASDDRQADLLDDRPTAQLIGDYCFFDIYELTREIGLHSNKAQNRDNVRKMIERLKDTTFSVDASQSQYWRERYMPDSALTKGDYSYITEFYSAEDWYTAQPNSESPTLLMEDRYYVVKFHSLVMHAMTTPRHAFISHEGLKSERHDLAHRLSNWTKPVIGVRDLGRPKDHHQYTLDLFHQRVRPAARLDNFERQFFNLARRRDALEDDDPHAECVRFKYDKDGNILPNGVFWSYGYYFKIEENESLALDIYRKTRTLRRRRRKTYPVITVWRDRQDALVGDESDHNKALRRQARNLLGDVADKDQYQGFGEGHENHPTPHLTENAVLNKIGPGELA